MTLDEYLNFMKAVTVSPAGSHFRHWQEQGIKHGFEGVGGHLQEYHHCDQVHGTALYEAGKDTAWNCEARIAGDGIYSNESKRPVAVKTADCVPILLHSESRVMAVHAGWRGLKSGIVSKALEILPRDRVQVGIGPCISYHKFEIGFEVVEEFLNSDLPISEGQWQSVFQRGVADRWHCDLATIVLLILAASGVSGSRVALMRTCTMMATDQWHSYRRDGVEAGRNWSWICLS
ncbi:polyphenol oxidase family protein [Pseudobacteriovorax antillogorgiicola]|uniref:YfiH family protein n=1 Tax=Pseudobacteriovorax antillogorgiicola TaxID=1513793 RepID=A0A1Y6B6U2_9BACT|nr:polyphenol oxidase family protein [Pseudobacteriovorax antillogorgiicola]TCS58908.1 hypothetical protein EDD56_102423 [Pseudobacteriovorax antillogorgiicola]SME93302.1 conserved hypothetical protein [Pseudobacteriovorax antillogorgiicola]